MSSSGYRPAQDRTKFERARRPQAQAADDRDHPLKSARTHLPFPLPSTASLSPAPPTPTPFERPSSLQTLSYSPSGTLEFTDAARKYFVQPPQGADLRYGYARWVRADARWGARLDGLLRGMGRVGERMDGGAEGAGRRWVGRSRSSRGEGFSQSGWNVQGMDMLPE